MASAVQKYGREREKIQNEKRRRERERQKEEEDEKGIIRQRDIIR